MAKFGCFIGMRDFLGSKVPIKARAKCPGGRLDILEKIRKE